MAINKRQTLYSLPDYLENIIYNKIGATHEPNYQEAKFNLDADENKVKWYLGTYFVRTFVELYNICENLLRNQKIFNELKKKEEISLLDIGSGTGGGILGTLHCLYKNNLLERKTVNVVSIEGNNIALGYQKILMEYYCSKNPLDVKPQFIEYTFTSDGFENELRERFYKLKESGFEFIISSKFINELAPNVLNELYTNFIIRSSTRISSKGFVIITDMTIKTPKYGDNAPPEHLLTDNPNQIWLPTLINREALNSNRNVNIIGSYELKQIIPLSCAFWGEKCYSKDNCYIQNIFEYKVESLNITSNEKIAYYVFTPKKFANEILLSIPKKEKYHCNWHNRKEACTNGCLISNLEETEYLNGFILEQVEI